MVYGCKHYRIPELSQHPRKETSYPLSSHSQFTTSSQLLAATNLLSMNLPILDISFMWPAVPGFFHLA